MSANIRICYFILIIFLYQDLKNGEEDVSSIASSDKMTKDIKPSDSITRYEK